MRKLKTANFAATELPSSVGSNDTEIAVEDASNFPDETPFLILIHDRTAQYEGVLEIMEITAIDKETNTLSTTEAKRGLEGTTAQLHDEDSRVECVLTGGTIDELFDTLANHSIRHEDGGDDEVNLEDLEGESAELKTHKLEEATETELGHIKVGENLSIEEDGTLNAEEGMEMHNNEYHDPDFETKADADTHKADFASYQARQRMGAM